MKLTNGENLELYPVPHKIKEGGKSFTPQKKVNLVAESGLDEATINWAKKIIEQNNYQVVSNKKENLPDYFNVFLGLDKSNEFVEHLAQEKHLDFHQKGFDPYLLAIEENMVIVIGDSSDSVFYGLATLNQILTQCEKVIPELIIHDYADTKIRGFIEGYYGIPWSDANRKDLMKFGGQFKMNGYIFAPKDDPYHRDNWDELYPKEKLAALKELATVGNETKCRFIWTISPLQKVAKLASEGQEVMSLLKGNTEQMLKKFQQLYEIGVRQFGVLGDDVGALPFDYVVKLMQDTQKWCDEKGDVYPLLYCPSSYNSDWAWNAEELNAYEKGYPKDVEIFWTGSKTCGPIVQETIETFKNKENDGLVRRDPLFWLNWPVNDIDMTQVFLGKGEMLQQNIQNLAGVVTNPMQEAQASKIAIFTIADYAWNTRDYNPDASWNEAFHYIEKNQPEALKILASHMTNTGIDGILDLEESVSIKDVLPKILEALKNKETINESDFKVLQQELENIAHSADVFLQKGENKELVKELTPFVLALKETALTAELLLQTTKADETKGKELYQEAEVLRKKSLGHVRITLKDTIYAKPAQRHLQPFVDEMFEILR